VLGVYRFHPKQVRTHFRMAEVAARYHVSSDPTFGREPTPTRSGIPETTREFQAGANYYINRNVRFLAQGVIPVDDRDGPGATIIGRMQVLF
jgi:hypothetical protein